MARNNVLKLITMMIMISALEGRSPFIPEKSLHDFDEKLSLSPTCIKLCFNICKGKGLLTPVCFAECIYGCKDSPVVTNDVPVCTSTCARSACPKSVTWGN